MPSPAVGPETAAAVARPRQRNIVLLSDGTGNSAAKLHKTNVWWLYQALDLGARRPDRDLRRRRRYVGVPPAAVARRRHRLGPVAQRARSLRVPVPALPSGRSHLCLRVQPGRLHRAHPCRPGLQMRHSRPEQTVPRFRLFRLGYEDVQLKTDEGLTAGVRLAYRSYRRSYNDAPFVKLYRWLRDLFLMRVPMPDDFRRRHALDGDPDEKLIKFIGVWDTVDAVRAQDPPRRLQANCQQHGRLYATRPAYLVPAGRCARADLETQSRDL